MDTTLQTRVEVLVTLGFAVMLGIWVLASTIVVLGRALYDRRQRRLIELSVVLANPSVAALPPLERSPAARRILSRWSRWDVYRTAVRPDAPLWMTDLCAAYCLEVIGLERMIQDASPGARRRKWRRISALLALGHARSAAVHDVLQTAIHDPDADVENAAVVTLHRLGDERAAAILVAALRQGFLPRSRVATHLERFHTPVDALLRPLLSDPEPETRQWAVALLSRYPDVAGVDVEIAALADDPQAPVRKVAVQALASMSAAVAVPAARRKVRDSAPYVRSAAIRVLGSHGAIARGEHQRRDIASWIAPSLADTAWEVRLATKESLARLGPSVWREVADHLDSSDAFARNGAAEVLLNLGLVDWTLRGVASGVEPPAEILGVVKRALREGGDRMADAVAERSTPEPMPGGDLALVPVGGVTS